MDVDAGELDKRITIIKRILTRTASGHEITSDTTVRRPWAKFSRTGGTEIVKGNADAGEVKARFLIRHSSKVQIHRKMIVLYAGLEYEIEYINDYNDSHEFDEIICKRLTKGAR